MGRMPIALGITNQRETVIIWDRKTGEPIDKLFGRIDVQPISAQI